jgi:hypothetical protein
MSEPSLASNFSAVFQRWTAVPDRAGYTMPESFVLGYDVVRSPAERLAIGGPGHHHRGAWMKNVADPNLGRAIGGAANVLPGQSAPALVP